MSDGDAESLVLHHRLSSVEYVGTQVGQPLHSREDPVRLAVFGPIDDLSLLVQILRTYLRERRPNDV